MSKRQTSEDVIPTDMLAESDNFAVWLSKEPDGETVYHVELGSLTLHFFEEEWQEFSGLISATAEDQKPNKRKK